MVVFFDSLQGVLVILVMIVIGYILARSRWFSPSSSQIIARIVTQIALPMYMIDTITKDFTKQQLAQLLPNLKYPVISMMILFGLSVAIARLLHVRKNRRGLFQSMFLIQILFLWAYPLIWLYLVLAVYHMFWFIIWPTRHSFGHWEPTSFKEMVKVPGNLISSQL